MVRTAYSHQPFYETLKIIGYNFLSIHIIIFIGLYIGEIYPKMRRYIYNITFICILGLSYNSYYMTKKLISKNKKYIAS